MPHISFSALKNWDFCPFYHKLTYIDKVKIFQGNVYTAFGTALHDTCENLALNEGLNYKNHFKDSFKQEINKLNEIPEDQNKLITEMYDQGIELASMILKALSLKFPEYKVFSAEEKIIEELKDSEIPYDYKGFLDLVIQTPDNKYHIIDWKSCSWGWNIEKKTDRITTYQLTYYKNFFCQKHNIDPTQVETYFGLLKRTANKNKVEFYRVSSGPRKIKNALNILNKAVYNIHNNNHPKNRLKCSKCEFNKTEWCS
jgi:ATP-dependent exoDNAse (exonuclease V) beta subunit|tara:strand:- start:2177 stop:2944 length:768 start_codon:yes stop_codon:yes gene_type:complete